MSFSVKRSPYSGMPSFSSQSPQRRQLGDDRDAPRFIAGKEFSPPR